MPGFVNGAPVRSAEDVNAVAYMSLLSDNINKVPRDLKEVGPTDLEYSSSEVLYIRVNNPNMLTIGTNASLVPWNQQYYPDLKKQNILSIASVRDMEIAAIPFVANAPKDWPADPLNFKDKKLLIVPEVYWDFCNEDVMVMERMYGTPISHVETLRKKKIDIKQSFLGTRTIL